VADERLLIRFLGTRGHRKPSEGDACCDLVGLTVTLITDCARIRV
jgi:hypothetical protein